MFNKFIKNEKGAVLPIVAVFLAFVAFGMAAIVIDVGFLYAERRELVTAADAAALAGAKEMQKSGSTESQVKAVAKNVAIANGAVNTDEDDVEVYFTGSTSDTRVRVTVENTVNLFFAGFFTEGSSVVNATAVASPMRLNPGIFPIGIDANKAYGADGKPKTGLIYLHGDKDDPNSFADLLNLDGDLNGASFINDLIVSRDTIIGSDFATNLDTNGTILDAGGWKNLSVKSDETVRVLLDKAYQYSDSPALRKAYMTALAPVYTSVDKDGAHIKEFAEIVIVDQINVKNGDVKHIGLDNAFYFNIDDDPIVIDYSKRVTTPILYPKQTVQNGTDLVIVYFTGAIVSVPDLLKGNYSGTYYEQIKLNAISLIE